MAETLILEKLRNVARDLMPKGTNVWLYGSRARGDARPDSDWDVLIILDKDKIDYDDFARFGYPLEVVGWDYDAGITPILYTSKDWNNRSITPFYKNVIRDKKVIYES